MGDAVIVQAVRTPIGNGSRPGRSPAFTRSTASAGTSDRRSARTSPPATGSYGVTPPGQRGEEPWALTEERP